MTKICVRKRGFTLAEVMIVLTVIGVLTAILLPVARQSMPDENLMKFKKAHNTLGTAIRELVTSDKYYLDGDLGTKSDSTVLDKSNDNNFLYFCNTIADVVSTKEINCKKDALLHSMVLLKPTPNTLALEVGHEVTSVIMQAAKNRLDWNCLDMQSGASYISKISNIVLTNNVVIYEGNPDFPFGNTLCGADANRRCLAPPSEASPVYYDINNMDVGYKQVCIDIDGFATGEDPFGYGIRADGKILTGARADEWLEKDVNEE